MQPFVLLVAALAVRAEPVRDIEDMSLQDLLNADTTVASAKKTKLRESPGVVTVVTRDEIVASGARDLIDVLALVPGFSFSVDVQGVVDVGFRGNWGHEGKVLLLYDGQEMNETLYSSLQMGNHYPIANIDRIEIIRGPGSALYGGYAELAVINIVTRKGGDVGGIGVWGEYGQQRLDYGRRNLGATYGQKYTGILDGLSLSIDGTLGEGNRTDRTYRGDINGDKRGLAHTSAVDPGFVNVGASYKGLEARFILDDYRTTSIDAYDALLPDAANENFLGFYGELRYDVRLFDTLTITPRLQAKRQYPWNSVGSPADTDPVVFYNKVADRYRGGVTLAWDALPTLNLLVGDEIVLDNAERLAATPGGDAVNTYFGPNKQASVSYWTEAAYGQMLVETPLVNVTAGARYEYQNQFGPSFVPRVALTHSFDKLSLKLLVSGAFKAPGIENININAKIKPERTRVYEAEVGYEVNENVSLSANAFDITIDDPIVYTYDATTDSESYVNSASTGTRGVELQGRLREAWGSITLGYSYASADGKNFVDLYQAGPPDQMRGMPGQKLTALGIFKLSEHVSIAPSLVYYGEKFGYLGDPAHPVERLPATALVNVFLRVADVGVRGLDLGVGAYNLLDVDDEYVQPYDGGHGPLPGPSREVMARLEYAFPL